MPNLLHQTLLDAWEHDKIITLDDEAGARRLRNQLHHYRQKYRQLVVAKGLEKMEEVVVKVRGHTVFLTIRSHMTPTAQEIEAEIEKNRKKRDGKKNS